MEEGSERDGWGTEREKRGILTANREKRWVRKMEPVWRSIEITFKKLESVES